MSVVGYFDTLAEAQKLVRDILLQGIIEEVVEEGQLVQRLPVTQLDGKSMTYNRESVLPSGDFYDIGESIPAQHTVAFTQVSVALKRLIGQWELDNFVANTYKDPNDMRAAAIGLARKGVLRTLEDAFVYGDAATNAKQFDGLQKLIAAAMRINQGSSSTGAALSLMNLDKLIDSVKPKPDVLLTTFNIWRRLSAVGRGGTTSFPLIWIASPQGALGEPTTTYRGIPLVRSDYALQTEAIASNAYSAKTGGVTGSIFAVRFGRVEGGGLSMLMGNPLLEFKEIEMEGKDATLFRLVTYAALALGSTKSLGVIDGITDAAVTA